LKLYIIRGPIYQLVKWLGANLWFSFKKKACTCAYVSLGRFETIVQGRQVEHVPHMGTQQILPRVNQSWTIMKLWKLHIVISFLYVSSDIGFVYQNRRSSKK
jgi:hypothetical protein